MPMKIRRDKATIQTVAALCRAALASCDIEDAYQRLLDNLNGNTAPVDDLDKIIKQMSAGALWRFRIEGAVERMMVQLYGPKGHHKLPLLSHRADCEEAVRRVDLLVLEQAA